MKTIKQGSTGPEVTRLCELLGIKEEPVFSPNVESAVLAFQAKSGLIEDGIIGPKSWLKLLIQDRLKKNSTPEILDSDYTWASEFLGCVPAAVKAVVEVETGGRSGFDAPGKPQILFEGHVFWKELKLRGIDPVPLGAKYPSIVYPKWTKQYYKGGLPEWSRLETAKEINLEAALCSASAGLFQILGNNWKATGTRDVFEFWELMSESALQQFGLGLQFIWSSGLYKYLGKLDWASFARGYNGPGYNENQYDIKLSKAYNKYKNVLR